MLQLCAILFLDHSVMTEQKLNLTRALIKTADGRQDPHSNTLILRLDNFETFETPKNVWTDHFLLTAFRYS